MKRTLTAKMTLLGGAAALALGAAACEVDNGVDDTNDFTEDQFEDDGFEDDGFEDDGMDDDFDDDDDL